MNLLQALAKQLEEEKRKEAELEKNLSKTKAELDKDEKALAEDKKVFASKVRQPARLRAASCLHHGSCTILRPMAP